MMKAVVLKEVTGFDKLNLVELPDPSPGFGEVLVRVRAVSLNYRDLLIARGGYGSRQKKTDLIPLSDGAGEVVEVGVGVSGFTPGDRVTGSFFPSWISGELNNAILDEDLGRAHDGVLCELKCFKATGLAPTPNSLTDFEAAATPCAGLTAWSGIVSLGRVEPGQVVLVQGTGGVSIFSLQFAKMAGASVIAISSSSEKINKLKTIGADQTLNYTENVSWGEKVLEMTNGIGVDHVMEVGGAGTLKQSLRAVRPGGVISLVGVLDGARSDLLIPLVGSRRIRLQGVTVGPVQELTRMLLAIDYHQSKPVIDKVFPFTEIRKAYEHLESGRHFGKVCVAL